MKSAREAHVTIARLRSAARRFGAAAPAAAGSLWTLEGFGAVHPSRRPWAGPQALLVPGEDVVLLAVDLPLPTQRKRLQALPFAIEDRLIEPVEAVHLALGGEIAPRRYLVAVVRHQTIRQWIAAAEAAGLGDAAMMPDALVLPRIADDAWAVEIDGARALVRTGDGAGFAVPAARLVAAWEAAGRPRCVAMGGELPPAMAASDPLPLHAPELPAIDLRQGAHSRRAAPTGGAGRGIGWRIALVAGAGLAAHGAIAAVDTIKLQSMAAKRRGQAEALMAIAMPGARIEPGTDIVGRAAEMLPADGSAPSRFLPLLARSTSLLATIGEGASLRSIRYDDARLLLEIDGADAAAIARARQALRDDGLAVAIGPGRTGATILAVSDRS